MIVAATPADAEDLAALDAEVFGWEAWGSEAFGEVLASADGWGLIAREGEACIGAIIMTRGGDQADVATLGVSASHRRRGLGAALLDAAIDEAETRGIREIFLEVRASNEAAQALYRSRGFCIIARRRGYYRHPREDAVVMRARSGSRVGPIGSETA
ncbi:ribosomal protein S18-alanine N-acetyltransferase [Nanchangia anserum]|uniref:Ribosomal protein S18-alanine N-acetyltransferase n=1 Tax=Nanchangia anserum TaxID=2692125 RepID=A0A8I0GA40_9ACTO|nr:ribosomal protein S18-alanine N-acetyltransferase [Nanchangia anserum]MBD3689954.1 ribosomal protein S18-alanine N-acetyltransferase [Nanchangia anserum]QOX82239.1 ribosomal protein S18-alanine N-acetyltransferase [Nanchangia anserum]